MRIAALSDFHIGASLRTDSFGHRQPDFLRFLDRLEREHDLVVLLGDVFQTQHGWTHRRRACAAELGRAIARVPALWRRFSGPGYRYVCGNHDAVASTELGARESIRFEEDGFAVLLIHGHQFDPVLRAARPVAEAGTWVTGRLRAAGLVSIAEWLEGRDVSIKHERFGGGSGPYARAAARLLRTEQVDAVVMGHTHVANRVELASGVYANTGSCSKGMFSHVSIDTEARSIAVKQTRD